MSDHAASTMAQVTKRVVGRERELELTLAAVAAGRDIVLEGPPGTSKTTMLKAITDEWGIPLFFVEGNGDLTPAKLIGHHNPSRVMREDYSADNFIPGPLTAAMIEGGFLYIEEFNRCPEDTLNTLLTAMADRRITIPRVGTMEAKPTFRIVASMNPYDDAGTTRLSTSVHDRLNRLVIGYQDASAEVDIVKLRTGVSDGLGHHLADDAVALTRATREHEAVRQGSSVRGAIDLVGIALQLAALRGVAAREDAQYAEMMKDAMMVALSGRIYLDDAADMTAEQVLQEIWEDHFILKPAEAAPG